MINVLMFALLLYIMEYNRNVEELSGQCLYCYYIFFKGLVGVQIF